eukprot:1887261-Rhodomonas_salina.1
MGCLLVVVFCRRPRFYHADESRRFSRWGQLRLHERWAWANLHSPSDCAIPALLADPRPC